MLIRCMVIDGIWGNRWETAHISFAYKLTLLDVLMNDQ